MALDYGTKTKTLETRGRCEPDGIPEALIPLDVDQGGPIFRKVLVTLDLVETRHNSIRLPNNTIRNPAIAAPRLLWLSTGVARLTSPRRLSPMPANRRTQARTRKNATNLQMKD
jgi:hypothetical protein